MKRSCLSIATVLLLTTVVHAGLEVRNVQAAFGVFGPERKSLDIYPADEILFRFTIAGAKIGDDGRTDVVLSMKLTSATGEVLLAQDSPLRVGLGLGGDSFPAQARMTVGDRLPAGEYTLTITLVDKLTSEKTSFQRKLTCKPTEFALVAPEFFLDPEGKMASAAGGLVGQVLFFRLRAIGIDRTQDKIDTTMTVEVLDAAGKEAVAKPITGEIKNDDAEVVRKVRTVTYRGNLFLNRPGEFLLRITIADRLGKQTAKFETLLRVVNP